MVVLHHTAAQPHTGGAEVTGSAAERSPHRDTSPAEPDTDDMRDVDAFAERYAAGIRAAIESVRPGARGVALHEIQARLTQALYARDVFLNRTEVRRMARSLSDPRWSLKHPVAAIRELREAPTEEAGNAALEQESNDLNKRLIQVSEVVGVRSTRTMYGMRHTVMIDPWSQAAADRVAALAHPISVVVEPR
jgi:hypothetical protein